MAVEVYMPKNGMDMTEGTLVRWLKNVGERVEKDEPIMEIETDKVTMESESPASGVLLKKVYEDGAVVPVLTTLGYIGEAGEAVPDGAAAPAEQPASAEQPAAPASAARGEDEYDVAVIGGGPGGYVAAIRAAQLGAKVVLFERDTVGGTCLNRGCVPTKTFLKTAEYIHHIKKSGERGVVIGGEVAVDMAKVVANKAQVVKTLTGGVRALLQSNGVSVVSGEAQLADAHSVECGGKSYHARKTILCGGSEAVRIRIPGVEHPNVLTSTEILELQELPRRLCIIGGGVIGCEFASAFRAFGSEVTIVEQADRLMAIMDEEVSAELKKSLLSDGIELRIGEGVKAIREAGGEMIVETERGEVPCDKVLLSIGRRSNLDCLGKLSDQIRQERGKVVVDDCLRTSVADVYAVGDINGRSMLAHSASKMGEVAAENCVFGTQKRVDLRYVPNVLYTLPEAAFVGLTEQQAREKHPEGILIGRFPFSANSRGVASGEKSGFVKVIADKTYGEILGVHIVGGCASEKIAEPVALMNEEMTVQEVAERVVHAHPSYSEAFMEACKDAIGGCIHMPPKKK